MIGSTVRTRGAFGYCTQATGGKRFTKRNTTNRNVSQKAVFCAAELSNKSFQPVQSVGICAYQWHRKTGRRSIHAAQKRHPLMVTLCSHRAYARLKRAQIAKSPAIISLLASCIVFAFHSSERCEHCEMPRSIELRNQFVIKKLMENW